MIDPAFVQLISAIVAPTIGGAAGTYFGLRTALNGMKDGLKRVEEAVGEARDFARDASKDLETVLPQAQQAYGKIGAIYDKVML